MDDVATLPARGVSMARAVAGELPRGKSLPHEDWVRRHRAVTWLLAGHAVALAVFGTSRGVSGVQVAGTTFFLLTFACFAAWSQLPRIARSSIASVGLLAA